MEFSARWPADWWPVCAERDVVARVGGDEFAVILCAIDPEQAAVVVERIRRHLAHDAPADATTVVRVTASAGYVTLAPGSSPDPRRPWWPPTGSCAKPKPQGRDRTARRGHIEVG